MTFNYGAMNSGKSDSLIKTAYNYSEQGLSIATIKPSIDTKDLDIVARGGYRRSVDIVATPDMNLREAVQLHMSEQALIALHAVLVDESQFLQPEQIDDLYEVAKLDDISVMAYGLRTDFRSVVFPGSKRLFEIADAIEKLPTMCRCNSQAEFNCRKIGGAYVFEGDQVAIDGEEATYDSLCGTCYLTEQAKSLAETTTP